ncbi:flagellar biosynthesis repressor FlbT [uncultured Lentibacter sp.]|uniref:flagellar biosynthesis repressor FlbT n=1 Tax=uncultured Lentibacter sp. TaxID=1659309 RepID=UPI00260644A5|nr:flagellar biosynthesis repressor FlbT [uncultured Lentibacter sp.]
MSGLILKLGPRERVLINGAVIENGDKRSRLAVKTPGANILRLKDAIHPEEANTPVRRVCYTTQLLLSGDTDAETTKFHVLRRIEELSQILTDPDSRAFLNAATTALREEQYYRCLKALRALLPREERLLATRLQ